MCGILVVSHPTASESEFHLVQALCSAFALCQHGEAAFVCFSGLRKLSVNDYTVMFSFFLKWSKLRNIDVNVSGSYSSPVCLRAFKTKSLKVCQVLALI